MHITCHATCYCILKLTGFSNEGWWEFFPRSIVVGFFILVILPKWIRVMLKTVFYLFTSWYIKFLTEIWGVVECVFSAYGWRAVVELLIAGALCVFSYWGLTYWNYVLDNYSCAIVLNFGPTLPRFYVQSRYFLFFTSKNGK